MANRLTWQQEKRAETRERLLDAARRAFSQGSYAETTVNDILVLAEVGRTSFYKHFADKLAVAEALFENLMPDLTGYYVAIAQAGPLDAVAVRRWLDDLVGAYARHAAIMRVFAQVQSIEPRFASTVEKVQRTIMAGLGHRFGLFARAAAAGETRDGDFSRATLVIDMVDHLCATLAVRQVPLDRAQSVAFLGDVLFGILAPEDQG